jgi:pimeloyl-ACP methyl ester carboxylesterase
MLELIEKGSCSDAHPTPLLFVHGASLAAWCWDEHFLDLFADKGFRAVAVSLRGHGASTLSKPLNSCSIADYVEDVRTAVDMLGAEPVLIGHSMGCFVVQKYLVEKHRVPAAVLMAPATPQGLRRTVLRMFRRHPWIFVRASTFGDSADVFNTPALAREYLFCTHTPEPIVKSCAARIEPESARAGLDQMIRPPDARTVTAPLLVLGAKDDGLRTAGEVAAAAQIYQTDAEFFPSMGHMMMLEPGWQEVAERMEGWLGGQGL